MDYGYGNWLLVIISVVLFLYFVKAAFRPRTKTDWKTYGIFGAFITALFAEMYGFPLTIYLLTSFLGSKFPGLDFSHQSGHLLNDLLGIKGDPHFSLTHILSNILIVGGLVLLSSAWNTLYKSSKMGALATTGVYRYVRHPQYLAFILVIIGFLLQWPTLITLIMAPILVARYIFLARSEEREMLKKFGPAYDNYRDKVSGFFPFIMTKSRPAIFYNVVSPRGGYVIIKEMKEKFNFLTVLFIAVVLLGTLLAGMFIGSRGPVKQAVSTPAAQADSMAGHHAAPAPADETVFKSLVDKAAPDFGLSSFDGREIKLSDYKGKKVVIFFNEGAMCQPSCWDQMKAFSEDGYFKKNDVAVLDIVVDDNKTWQGVLSQDPALKNSLVLLDTDKKVSQTYGVLTIASSMHKGEFPGHTYIVLDKDGIIRNIFDDPSMRVNNLEIKEALNKIS